MKRDDNIYNYGHAVRQRDFLDHFVVPALPAEVVDEVSRPSDAFLRLVFARDPVSNLPTGDLQYMVSDKANPEVKQWVLQNLLIDTSSAVAPAPPKGISDDDLIALTRDSKETLESYVERVNNFMLANKDAAERLSESVVSVESTGAPVADE